MNWVDAVIIIFLFFFILEGFGRNLFSEVLDFVGFIAAFFISLRFYNIVASFYQSAFEVPKSLANVLGFITVWFLIETVLFTIIHLFLINKVSVKIHNRYINYFSVIPAFFRGLIFVSILLVLIATFPIQPRIKQAVERSTLGPVILSEAYQLEGPLKNVFGGITEDTLSFLTIKPKSDESVDLGFSTEKYSPNPELEQKMIDLVNVERRQSGLTPLIYREDLREVGRVHSADMFKRGYFSHYSPEGDTAADRAQSLSVKFFVIGENLAFAPNLRLAHNGLMNSEGHRANILSPEYGHIGIGIMDGGIYGLMVTQIFSD